MLRENSIEYRANIVASLFIINPRFNLFKKWRSHTFSSKHLALNSKLLQRRIV